MVPTGPALEKSSIVHKNLDYTCYEPIKTQSSVATDANYSKQLRHSTTCLTVQQREASLKTTHPMNQVLTQTQQYHMTNRLLQQLQQQDSVEKSNN